MPRLLQWLAAGTAILAVAPAAYARTQALPDLLKGRWTTDGGDCQRGLALELRGDSLRLTDAAGHVDAQRVTSRRPVGLSTRTTLSTHGEPAGKAWVYEVLAPGQLSLTEGSTGRSATLVRCPDPLPANASPQQIVATIYARYAADDEPNLPMSGETNVRAVFVPKLADDILTFAAHSGRVPDDCRPADPFVSSAFGDIKVTGVHVDAPPVPDTANQAVANVSFRNLGKPQTVTVTLDRTAAGWRIGDVSPASGQSLRAIMTACLAPLPP